VLSYRADFDALSELANRRAFDAYLAASWVNAVDQRTALALMLIDIDHFKAYNDHYGHQGGDRAIQRVSQAIKRVFQRPQDFASRYGGEEFAVILIDIDKPSALLLAERVREEILRENIEHEASQTEKRVSVSIGVAHVLPCTSKRTGEELVKIADEALYFAKESGRNRVVDADTISAGSTYGFSARPYS
jgi:diguanylate cyclase (GGDEF)-like protein